MARYKIHNGGHMVISRLLGPQLGTVGVKECVVLVDFGNWKRSTSAYYYPTLCP